MKSRTPVTIVVPVYADWESLQTCLESLIRFVKPIDNVMIVNDCGPEADVLEGRIQNTIKDQNNFAYFRNQKNLGFLKTCNRAVLELDKTKNDVLLLNSDTEVTEGFLDELSSVLAADPNIAAVSPRSNNATIATVPLSAAGQKGIAPSESHKLFQLLKSKLPKYNLVPTAHGFCMLIKRSVIREYGLFDEAFGKGYGEEVDFCQRIAKHGYKSAICNTAFVFHLEARSFTLEAKEKLLEKSNQIIWERYPNYREEVRRYMVAARETEDNFLPKLKKPFAAKLKAKLRSLL